MAGPSKPNKIKQYVAACVTVVVVSVIGFLLSDYIGYKIIAFVLLVTVSLLAMFMDIFPVLLAALLSALIWDFFFIPPRFTFNVGSAEDSLMLLMYFIIALVNAALTYKIRQAEKEAMKKEEKVNTVKLYNTLLNSLSHELRTPISAIIGASDNLLNGSQKLSEKDRKVLLEEISSASLRLNQQVGNLLNMSRLESGFIALKLDWCDVNEMLHTVVNRLHEILGKRVVHIRLQENFPLFKLDQGLLETVIHNLVLNAAIYTPENSVIDIAASHVEEVYTKSEVVEKVRSKLVITVADNGGGFPKDKIKMAFDKFFRIQNSKTGGTGLGLSIAKGFVEAHNGTITLENAESGGAKFTITIPGETSWLKNLKHE